MREGGEVRRVYGRVYTRARQPRHEWHRRVRIGKSCVVPNRLQIAAKMASIGNYRQGRIEVRFSFLRYASSQPRRRLTAAAVIVPTAAVSAAAAAASLTFARTGKGVWGG